MANIGEPVRRHTVIPLSEPITAPEGPIRTRPTPQRSPSSPGAPGGTYAFGSRAACAKEAKAILKDIADRSEEIQFLVFWGGGWDAINETTSFVLGTVKMWGDVVEHEHGYRAEFAKLNSIDVLYGGGDIDLLRAKYSV